MPKSTGAYLNKDKFESQIFVRDDHIGKTLADFS